MRYTIGVRTLPPDRHRLYEAWKQMRSRCSNRNRRDYKYYGGRGITITPDWNNFFTFEADMGPHPGQGWTLEREDNNAGYDAGNCIWANRTTQARNRRSTRMRNFLATPGSPVQVAALAGVHPSTVYRARRGQTWR